MRQQHDARTTNPSAGRSGNDYLQQGGAGYQSWAAEGPSGVTAAGTVPDSTDSARVDANGRLHRLRGALPSSLGKLVAAVGVGAAAMYFLDPDRGARRRNTSREKLASLTRSAAAGARDAAVDAGNRLRGRAAEVRGRLRDAEVSDEQLVARVRSELGHHVERVRPIEVVADHGAVTLRGVARADELPSIVEAVAHVRGVERVTSELEVRDEGAAR